MSKAGPPRSARSEADEPRIAEAVLIEGGQVGRLAGEQEGRVERAGRGAVHLVESVAQAELLDRRGHPGRHHAAHPAALDDQRDPAAVGSRARARALLAPAPERLHDRVRPEVLGDDRGGPERVVGEAGWLHERLIVEAARRGWSRSGRPPTRVPPATVRTAPRDPRQSV